MPETNHATTLQQLRARKGLPQSAIGSRPMIAAVERGERLPGTALLRRMALALGEPPEVVYAACEASYCEARAALLAAAKQQRNGGGK